MLKANKYIPSDFENSALIHNRESGYPAQSTWVINCADMNHLGDNPGTITGHNWFADQLELVFSSLVLTLNICGHLLSIKTITNGI